MARLPAQHSRRLALGAGLTIAAVAAGAAASGTAHAAPAPVPAGGGLDGLSSTLPGPVATVTGALTKSVTGIGYLRSLQLNPLAKTPVDPLANAVGTQIADFKPVSTEVLTGPLSAGGALQDLPLLGPVVKGLPL
ncbi:hypothetical protein ACFVIM_25650 [Streptomyces sp. NPDC057638]|uniref:hypothetical protein n=1 Tax=Streptomyces sp. NPDC057638 TaxID=3346190 RepID=UPI0036A8F953